MDDMIYCSILSPLINFKVTENSFSFSPLIKKFNWKDADSLVRKYFHDEDSVVPFVIY